MLKQKTILQSAKLAFQKTGLEENKVCAVYKMDVVKKNVKSLSVKVIAWFELKKTK